MLSSKSALAISCAVIIIFAGISYVTIVKSSQGISIGPGRHSYLSINSDASDLYLLSRNTTYIFFNLTLYTAPTTIYLLDISPLNASAYQWVNITSFPNQNNYEVLSVSNGTVVPVKLLVNQQALNKMPVFNPSDKSTYFRVLLLVISSSGGEAATGFAVARAP
jgi:hypothetical protein